MRITQPIGTKGSLKWIQRAVARNAGVITPTALAPISWLSPREEDSFAEYRDAAFLELLGLGHLAKSLSEIWPKRGPQWDALGLSAGLPVLVEAKAHLAEFNSPASAASAASLAKIARAFDAVKADLAPNSATHWARVYYQYANRLAHLWWLHQRGVQAHLVFVSFLNDAEMGGPVAATEWEAAFHAADKTLGLPTDHGLSAFVHHLYPDVRALG